MTKMFSTDTIKNIGPLLSSG
ncbi:hypothetical protein ACQ27_gp274 [Klebsiella phage K64-1]|nr:hypothetical protein ACQ27_gp274 [Klebsiella phage K64-1]